MNPYYASWYQEANAIFDPVHKQAQDENPPSVMQTAVDLVVEDVKDRALLYVITAGLSYMATTQFESVWLRAPISIVGKAGLRLLPVIGTAYLAYSVYDWLKD